MNNITFKSKKQVVTNPRTQEKNNIKMSILNIVYHPFKKYEALAEYYYEKENQEQVDKIIVDTTLLNFTFDDVENIENIIKIQSKDSFNKIFNKLIIEVAKIELSNNSFFGLKGDEWELVE